MGKLGLSEKPSLKHALGVPLIFSTLAIALQFLQTRIFSVLFFHHIVYVILTISLLGFAASGALVSLWRRRFPFHTDAGTLDKIIAIGLAGFAISSILSMGAIGLIAAEGAGFLGLGVCYLLACLPFVFFGCALLSLFQQYPANASSLYYANLTGSALGCLWYLLCITPLGAISFLRYGIFLPSAALALFFCWRRRPAIRAAIGVALVLGLIFGRQITVEPHRDKQFHTMFTDKVVEFSQWNPISRVDVVSERGSGQKHIMIDGDAQAPLFASGDRVWKESKFSWPAKTGVHSDASLVHFDTPSPEQWEATVQTRGWAQAGISLLVRPQRSDSNRSASLRLTSGTVSVSIPIPKSRKDWTHLFLGLDAKQQRLVLYTNYLGGGRHLDLPHGLDTGLSLRLDNAELSRLVVWDQILDPFEIMSTVLPSDSAERAIPYVLRSLQETSEAPENVLVIGNGGGADSLTAYNFGTKNIHAVEINPSSHRLIQGQYSDYVGHLFRQKNVSLFLEDGRSFVRRSSARYDVEVMMGVDSFAALSSGAYVLSESYLYTNEALSDYWDHLSDTGLLQIGRPYFSHLPREPLRLLAMAYEMLLRKGVSDPFSHLLVVANRKARDTDSFFAAVILSRKPLRTDSLALLGKWMDLGSLEILFQKGVPRDNVFHEYANAAMNGSSDQFFLRYPYNVRPVSDDSPFFFQYGKWFPLIGAEAKPYRILLLLLGFCLLAVGGLIWISRPRIPEPGAPQLRTLVYFGCLGVGFMFVEIFLMQKFVLVLGHPIYSMAFTLPALLIAAACGSAISHWLNLSSKPYRLLFFGLLGLALVTAALWIPALSLKLLPLAMGQRLLGLGAIVLPLGFLLGIPYPSGLRALSPWKELIPLAWTVNAGFSVLGSLLAILIAMTAGFSALMAVATALYGTAWLLFPRALASSNVPTGIRGFFDCLLSSRSSSH